MGRGDIRDHVRTARDAFTASLKTIMAPEQYQAYEASDAGTRGGSGAAVPGAAADLSERDHLHDCRARRAAVGMAAAALAVAGGNASAARDGRRRRVGLAMLGGGSTAPALYGERGWATHWATAPPRQLWAAQTGPGYGAPAVAGARVYILGGGGRAGAVSKSFASTRPRARSIGATPIAPPCRAHAWPRPARLLSPMGDLLGSGAIYCASTPAGNVGVEPQSCGGRLGRRR